MPYHHDKGSEQWCKVREVGTTKSKQQVTIRGLFVTFHGVDHSCQPVLDSFDKKTGAIIIKIRGRSSWYALGESKYYPPEYLIGYVRDGIYVQTAEIEYTRSYQKAARLIANGYFEKVKKDVLFEEEDNESK